MQRWAKHEVIGFGALLALAAATLGCVPPGFDRTNAVVNVTIQYQGIEPAPKSLLLSWLRCGEYLFDRQRVPADGPLTHNPASVYIKLRLSGGETRAVVVEAIASERLVARATGRIDVRPMRTTKLDLRLAPIEASDMVVDTTSDCGADASPPRQAASVSELPRWDLEPGSVIPADELTER